jgi:hypothetical protein
MSEKLKPQQLREMAIRLGGSFNPDQDLEHVETYQVTPETQASLNAEYIKFLEAKNARLEKLCAEASAWIARYQLRSACLINAQALLSQALQLQRPCSDVSHENGSGLSKAQLS